MWDYVYMTVSCLALSWATKTVCNLFFSNKDWPNEVKKTNKIKLGFQLEEFACHVTSMIYVWPLIQKYNLLNFNEDNYLARIVTNTSSPDEFHNIYKFYFAIWIYQLATAILKPENLRAKYNEMLILHHIITISLLSCSMYLDLFEFGLIVVFLHDSSDIFLDISKMSNYTQQLRLAKISLVVLNISWVYTRLYLFGNILYKMLYFYFFGNEYKYVIEFGNIIGWNVAISFIFVLSILYLFNLIWYVIMSKIIIKVMNKKDFNEVKKLTQEAYE